MATAATPDVQMSHGFGELDDLVLHLKGLVLVQDLRGDAAPAPTSSRCTAARSTACAIGSHEW